MKKIINQDSLVNLSGGADCSTWEGFAVGMVIMGGIIGGSTGGVGGAFLGVFAGASLAKATLELAGCT